MSNGRRCAACRYLRRRCSEDCILAPYFPTTHPERFHNAHKIFGTSNLTRMLQQLPEHERAQAADSISLEAYWRVEDPVYGSVKFISSLQREIYMKQRELARIQEQITMHKAHTEASQLMETPLPWSSSVSNSNQLQGLQVPSDHGLLDPHHLFVLP